MSNRLSTVQIDIGDNDTRTSRGKMLAVCSANALSSAGNDHCQLCKVK